MFRSIDDFLEVWKDEAAMTQGVFAAITDASLTQAINQDHRTIGRLAWHIAHTIPEMMGKAGLKLAGPGDHDPVPASAKAIGDAYSAAAASLATELKTHWTDASLANVEEMYGEPWSRAFILRVLVLHQAHHRGQLSVLMRQAGLRPAAMYGPNKEAWAQWKMEAPKV